MSRLSSLGVKPLGMEPPSPRLTPLRAEDRPSRIPLSLSQQFWFDRDFQQSMPLEMRRTAIAFRLVGPFSPDAMAESLRQLISRHEALRTRYVGDGDVAYQEVMGHCDPRLAQFDLQTRDPPEFQRLITDVLRREYVAAPAYETGHALRSLLFKLRPKVSVLALIVDHIAHDNRSMNIIVEEVFSVYRALAEQRRIVRLPVTYQYADYALWAQPLHAVQRQRSNEAAWREKLQDTPATDVRRTGNPDAQGESARGFAGIKFGEAATRRLYEFARDHGLTAPIVLIAAVGILLARWTHQDRVLAGCVVDGRPPQMKNTVGSFVRTAPLYLDLSGDPTVTELLALARRAYLDANDARKAIHPKRIPHLGRISLNIQKPIDARPADLDDPGEASAGDMEEGLAGSAEADQTAAAAQRRTVVVSPWRWEGKLLAESGIDLHIYLLERPNLLRGYLLYDAGALDEGSVAAFLGDFPRLLCEMAERPNDRISQLLGA